MKILIAADGSNYNFMAIERACEMVIKPESHIMKIISVYHDVTTSSPEPLEISEEQLEKIENIGYLRSIEYCLKAEEIIKEHFPDDQIEISMKVVKGSAKKMIIEEAEKWKADLIVVGSLGHNFLSRLFLGSVSEAVLKYAECSVLIIRGTPAV